VREESGRGKSRFKIRDLLADVRCSQAVLDFLSTTDVERLVPVEEVAGSEVSEWELSEHREREEERRAEAEELRRWRGSTFASPHALVHGIRGRGPVDESRFLSFSLSSFLRRASYLLGTGLGVGQRAADGNRPTYAAIVYTG